MITLVLGGARSGKSRYAEALAGEGRARIYLATAEVFDDEMRERVAAHRAQRGGGWTTREAPLDLVEALREADAPGRFLLVDCVTLWINNLMYRERIVAAEVASLSAALPGLSADVALVANEVGLGIVPDSALGRAFRDAAGLANQALARAADRVVFIAAGLPLILK